MNRVKNKSHPSLVSPLRAPGTASMVSIVILWHPLWAIEESACGSSRDAFSLRIAYGLVHDHACHRFAVLFLLRGIQAVRLKIYREGVHSVLHLEIFDLSIMVGIVLMKNGDCPAVARRINP